MFTGVLDSLERDDASNLVKQYGGRVTTAPSNKTSYVVLGKDAGNKKLQVIREKKIPTIDEDGLLQLIATLPGKGGSGKSGQLATAKREAEEKKVLAIAKEMDREERRKEDKGGAVKGVDSQLWTEKYAPKQLKDICGNKTVVERLQKWLHEWY